MRPHIDYHMHTPLCGHAVGAPLEYAQQALDIGLQEIGFSDHAPMLPEPLPGITMTREELPEYHRMIEDTRKAFEGRLRVKIALEADFVPGYEAQTQAMLADYPYDYVLGSVHFIKDWGFDDPDQRARWKQEDVNAVYRDYHHLLRQSAQSGLFDIMAHVDLVKKFGHRPNTDLSREVQHTAEVFRQSHVAIEINTSGRRKPAQEMYPSLGDLKIYCLAGVPLTFGSDAHAPGDVGADFALALELARTAGYKEYCVFKDRAIEKTISF